MALTDLQRRVCALVAGARQAHQSYVAGGVALNTLIAAARISSDIDLFHDSEEALQAAWDADRKLLAESGYQVVVVRERPGFVEALIGAQSDSVIMQWVRDSAFRFFPLVPDPELGLTMHAFDLATNKVLALIGRAEPRDWIDIIQCDSAVQPLGFLAWAACGKDPGFSPRAIVEHAARTARYSAEEIGALDFAGEQPDAARLAATWHQIVDRARQVIDVLPGEMAGRCVLGPQGLFRGRAEEVVDALAQGQIHFHSGRLRGALPMLKP